MKYTNRRKVIDNGTMCGEVAQFGDDDWRCSAHPDAERFQTEAAAVEHLVKPATIAEKVETIVASNLGSNRRTHESRAAAIESASKYQQQCTDIGLPCSVSVLVNGETIHSEGV